MNDALTKFDYTALDTSTRMLVAQKTTEIRDRVGRAAQNIVEIGERLLVVKEKLGHGHFGAWLEAEFGWKHSTAGRMMQVATKFPKLGNIEIAPSALYLLASDSTPDEVRDTFIAAAQNGETVTHADVRSALSKNPTTAGDFAARKAELDAMDPLIQKYGHEGQPRKPKAEPEPDADIVIGNAFKTVPKQAAEPAYKTTECDELESLIGQKFGCIYADPPWKYGNQATRAATDNHYPTMTVSDIAALPVRQLAADDAHLHLWVTNGFLFDAKDILDAWGFEFRSTFVWCKPQMGIGNYWRNSHEILLTAIRGDAKRFNDRSLKSWESFDRAAHSAKPEKVREYIERASPGPRLELFGRKLVTGWTVWGNQIDRSMFDPEPEAA